MWLEGGDCGEFKDPFLLLRRVVLLADAGPRHGRLVWEAGSFTGWAGAASGDTVVVSGACEYGEATQIR